MLTGYPDIFRFAFGSDASITFLKGVTFIKFLNNLGIPLYAPVAMRTAFEFRTLYQPLELTALLNSPSAAFSSITNAAEMLKLIWIPNYFSDNSSPFK